MSQPTGPLGRDADPGDADPGDARQPVCHVHLLAMDVSLLDEAREHHDGLVREFRLLALSGDPAAGSTSTAARLRELTEVLGRQYGAAQVRRDEDLDDALARGERTLDLVCTVPCGVAAAATALGALVDEADALCAAEQLLSLERRPEVKRFARWCLEQCAVQCAGGAPEPWS